MSRLALRITVPAPATLMLPATVMSLLAVVTASMRSVPPERSDRTALAPPSVILPVCKNRSPVVTLVADRLPPTVPMCSGATPAKAPIPPLAVSIRLPAVVAREPEPLSVIAPTAPVPPSAFNVRLPVASVSAAFTAMPPVWLMIFTPPVVVGVKAVLMVVAPVCVAWPIVKRPVVAIVLSSLFDSSRVSATASVALPRLIPLASLVVLTVTPPAPAAMLPPVKAILSEVSVTEPEALPIVPAVCLSSVLAPVTVRPTVPDPPAKTVLAIVIRPLELRAMLPLGDVVMLPLVPSVPVLMTVTLPVFTAMPVIAKLALLVSATSPVPLLRALKLVTVLPLPVRLVPPLERVVSNEATTPLVAPELEMMPGTAVPPSAVRFSALVPAPDVNTLLIAMPPVLLISVVPPMALVVAAAPTTVIAPVLLELPMISKPEVEIVASSAADNSSVLPVVSGDKLPKLMASASVLLLMLTAPPLPATVPPVSAILSAVRLIVFAVPLLLMVPELVSVPVPALTATPVVPPAMMVPALVTPAPVTLMPVLPAKPMVRVAVLVTRPVAFTVTVLLLDVILPVPVVRAPVF